MNNLSMTFLPEIILMKELYSAAKFQAIYEAASAAADQAANAGSPAGAPGSGSRINSE
jgi:hypothetical protein